MAPSLPALVVPRPVDKMVKLGTTAPSQRAVIASMTEERGMETAYQVSI